MKDEPKPERKKSVEYSAVEFMIMVVILLSMYFMAVHSLSKTNMKAADNYKEIVEGLVDMMRDDMRQRQGCYCQPEDEPWN